MFFLRGLHDKVIRHYPYNLVTGHTFAQVV